jgi:hypothetical protein
VHGRSQRGLSRAFACDELVLVPHSPIVLSQPIVEALLVDRPPARPSLPRSREATFTGARAARASAGGLGAAARTGVAAGGAADGASRIDAAMARWWCRRETSARLAIEVMQMRARFCRGLVDVRREFTLSERVTELHPEEAAGGVAGDAGVEVLGQPTYHVRVDV